MEQSEIDDYALRIFAEIPNGQKYAIIDALKELGLQEILSEPASQGPRFSQRSAA